MSTIKNTIAVIIGAFVLAGAFILFFNSPTETDASVSVSSEYYSTTTYAADASPLKQLKTTGGTLGSVVVTGANTGRTFVYNATTSNASLRSPNKATSSILIAEIPASAVVGTYTFDVSASDGLLVVSEGLEATSTITYR